MSQTKDATTTIERVHGILSHAESTPIIKHARYILASYMEKYDPTECGKRKENGSGGK